MAQITQQDHDFLVEELRSGELSPEEQDRAMDLIEEFRATPQQKEPQAQPVDDGIFRHPAGEAGRAVVSQLGAVGSGIANTALDAAEFVMLGARGIYDSVPGPEADDRIAMLNRGRQQIRELRQAMNHNAEEGMNIALGTREFPKSGQMVGEMLAWWPLSRVMQGKNFKQIVGFGTLEGALSGAVGAAPTAEDFVDTLDSATMGALLSAGASATLMSGAGLTSALARKYRETLNSELGRNAQKLEREVQELTGQDFHFTVGDIAADNPWMAGLQVAAGKAKTLERQVNNMRALEQFMLGRSANLSPRDVVLGLHQTMNRAAKQMQDIANTRYSAGLDQLLAKYGDSIQVDGRLYRGALKEYIDEYADAVERGLAGDIPPVLRRHFDWLTKKVMPYKATKLDGQWRVVDTRNGQIVESYGDDAKAAYGRTASRNENEGGLSIEDTRVVLREFNKFISGPTGAFDDAAGSLGEMGKALKAKFLQSLSGQRGEAVRELNGMNKRYQFDMAQLDALKRNALGHIFGSKEELPALLSNPQSALDRLIRETGDPKAMQAARKLLEVHAPSLLVDLKKVVIQNLLRASRRADTSSAMSRLGSGTEVDLGAFAAALAGPGKYGTAGRVGLGLFSPHEQQELIRVGKALQVLNNTYMTRAMQDTAGTAADIAINVVSQTSEFMTRLLVRLTAKGNTVEQLMVDPKARKLVLELAERKPDSPKFKMALAALAYHVGAWESMADAEERERQAEELRQQTLDNPATSMQPGLR